jgi:methylmalonyl-CoA/ethylmalonyl-CoA epimerase
MIDIETVKAQFSRVHHVGIVVKDLKATAERLESFGIGPFENFKLHAPPPMTGPVLFLDQPLKSKTKVRVASIGDLDFEIFQPLEGDSPWMRFLNTHGEGIHHLGFHVDDLDAEISRFKENGAKIILYGRWQGGGGGVYFDLGAGDILIELVKYPPRK